jgi:translocator protein
MCQLAGIIGSLFTTSSIPTWYATLIKPSFNPPNWIFAPVWIFLYLLMGISFYLIWIKSNNPNFSFLMSVFLLQLVLNAFWSIIFFGLKSPLFAFVEIIVLWLTILICIILFFRISKISSYLLIPYLLWVSFAAVLNFAIWKLN